MLLVRCTECDRIVTDQSVGRLRDGRVVFGWCPSCMDVAAAVRTELTDRVKLFGQGHQVVLPMGPTSWESDEARSKRRVFALSMTALVLGVWGLTMTAAGFASSDEPSPATPQGSHSGTLLVGGGSGLIGTALGLYLAARRARHRQEPKPGASVRTRPDPQKSGTAL